MIHRSLRALSGTTMTDRYREQNPEPWEYAIATLAVITVAALLLLSSCSPKVIYRDRIQHDTTYVDKFRVDSIFKRDSVLIREKGDTVYIYQEKVREKYRFIHDTVSVVRVDSVAVETIKEVEVEKPLSWGQRVKLRSFGGLLLALLALFAWTFRKPLLKLLRI